MVTYSFVNKFKVSILCTTYNQSAYIRRAIDSFLSQEFEFDFEIVIHDDCSTDNTAFILKEYSRKYPQVIKVITPEKNLYASGINMPILNALSHCQGEYIAFCEGDDFWDDNKKLQKQFNVLSTYSNVDLCFTKSNSVDVNDCITGEICDYGNEVKIFTYEEVLSGGGPFMPSPSLFFRKSILDDVGEWFDLAPVGDIFIQALGSQRGGAVYLPETTCSYRKDSEGSWSQRKMSMTDIEISKTFIRFVKAYKSLSRGSQSASELALARELYYLSTKSFRLKSYSRAIAIINRSYSIHKNISNGQKLTYLLSKIPFVLYVLFKLKDMYEK